MNAGASSARGRGNRFRRKTDAVELRRHRVEQGQRRRTERRRQAPGRAALDARKEAKPAHNAVDMADEIGIAMLSEAQYRALQQLGEFDLKASSWVATPTDVRKLGGALFCDRRYGQVFVYHNGAQSYDAARGFRGALRV